MYPLHAPKMDTPITDGTKRSTSRYGAARSRGLRYTVPVDSTPIGVYPTSRSQAVPSTDHEAKRTPYRIAVKQAKRLTKAIGRFLSKTANILGIILLLCGLASLISAKGWCKIPIVQRVPACRPGTPSLPGVLNLPQVFKTQSELTDVLKQAAEDTQLSPEDLVGDKWTLVDLRDVVCGSAIADAEEICIHLKELESVLGGTGNDFQTTRLRRLGRLVDDAWYRHAALIDSLGYASKIADGRTSLVDKIKRFIFGITPSTLVNNALRKYTKDTEVTLKRAKEDAKTQGLRLFALQQAVTNADFLLAKDITRANDLQFLWNLKFARTKRVSHGSMKKQMQTVRNMRDNILKYQGGLWRSERKLEEIVDANRDMRRALSTSRIDWNNGRLIRAQISSVRDVIEHFLEGMKFYTYLDRALKKTKKNVPK